MFRVRSLTKQLYYQRPNNLSQYFLFSSPRLGFANFLAKRGKDNDFDSHLGCDKNMPLITVQTQEGSLFRRNRTSALA